MHPVTRLGRVIQQLRSFGDLHASELEMMAVALDAAGAADLAQRLRAYRDVQRQRNRGEEVEGVFAQPGIRLSHGRGCVRHLLRA